MSDPELPTRILAEVGDPLVFPNTLARSQPTNPEITALSGGGFVAIWQETDTNVNSALGTITNPDINDLFAQIYDAYGVAVGSPFSLETSEASWPGHHSTYALEDGGFSVFFELLHNTGTEPHPPLRALQVNTYDENGVLTSDAELAIPGSLTTRSEIGLIDTTTLADGKVVFLMQVASSLPNPGDPFRTEPASELNMFVYDPSDPGAGLQDYASGPTLGYLFSTDLIPRDDGGLTLVYTAPYNGFTAVHVNQYDSLGTRISGKQVFEHYDIVAHFNAIELENGDLQLSWTRNVEDRGTIPSDPSTPLFGLDVYSLRVTADGEIVSGEEAIINTTRVGSQVVLDMVDLGVDGHAVIWLSQNDSGSVAERNLILQHFDTMGNMVGPELVVPAPDNPNFADRNPFFTEATALADGNVIVSWLLQEIKEVDSVSHDSVVLSDIVLHRIGAFYDFPGTSADDDLVGSEFADVLGGRTGNDRLVGLAGDDYINGQAGVDTLNGGDGHDTLIGGFSPMDLRDVVYAGAGNDSIDAGAGNDLVFGQGGNDTIAGGAGVDELQGQEGDDVITGSNYSDLVFGGAGNDFVNGGFGSDRINGGSGADKFFHAGVLGHGSDWVQDYVAADGDVLLWGGGPATADDFQVNLAHTANDAGERSGDDAVQEAFVIYKPTEQILWALVDGEGQSSINLQIGGDVFDLLA